MPFSGLPRVSMEFKERLALLGVTKSDWASGYKPQVQWSHAVPGHFLSCQVSSMKNLLKNLPTRIEHKH